MTTIDFRKSRYAMLFVIITCYLSLSFAATPARPVMDQAEPPIARELALFGPAAATLTNVGFQPKGQVTLFRREEVQGTDQLRVEVEGLPAHTAFTIFLSELNTVPFGSLQYIAEVSTDNAGRGSVVAKLVVSGAFALRTELNPVPPPVFATPISVDLNHIVLWFADSSADDPFTTAGTGPFDSDRDSGVAVLRTIEPLP